MSQSTPPPSRRGRSARNAPPPVADAEASQADPDESGSESQPPVSSQAAPTTQAAIGFLLNDGSSSTHYPAMPKLESTSNTHFNAWKAKALLYFDQYGLRNTVKYEPEQSLLVAIQLAGKGRDFASTFQKWMGLHEKAYALIRAATQRAVGMQLFRELETVAADEETEPLHILTQATTVRPSGSGRDTSVTNPANWEWINNLNI